jgi:hypothetical protein
MRHKILLRNAKLSGTPLNPVSLKNPLPEPYQ